MRYGPGAVEELPDLVRARGARRVLLVTGGRSFDASGAARILPRLAQVAAVERWSGVPESPDAADLLPGLQLFDRFRPDLVLAVGGGSVMDAAKLLCAYAGTTDLARLRDRIRAGGPVTTREPGLVAVPTTCGSGSEATSFAVVYLGEEKFSVAGPVLRPDVAVLDPQLVTTAPAYTRAAAGMDAVAQAVESLWAVGATDTSRRWARHALRLLLPAVERFATAPDVDGARAMVIGAHLAGRAIDISKTTGAHALSYAITKRYGVAHGHAVALTLGGFLHTHHDAEPSRLLVDPATHAAVMAELRRYFGARDGRTLREAFDRLARGTGLTLGLAAIGADTPEARASLASAVNVERLSNNPVRFTQKALVRLVNDVA